MNERYHFYLCIDPKKMPPYQFFDSTNALAGYPNKLPQEVTNNAGAYYLGFMTEKEVINRPKRTRSKKLNKKRLNKH